MTQDVEQLQVQLAGCLTAAEGHPCEDVIAGVWGWSPALEAVKTLHKAAVAAVQAGGPSAALAFREARYDERTAAWLNEHQPLSAPEAR